MNERASIERITAAQNGDKIALEKLLCENSGLIWSTVKRYYGCGADTDDLFQLGCIGFMKAVYAFDVSYGTQFSTYAVPKIAGEIRRYLRDDGCIKISRSIKEKARLISRTRDALAQNLGREPKLSEISEVSGISAEDIAEAVTAVCNPESLQKENGDGNISLESVLGDSGQEERIVEHIALREAIKALPDKQRKILILRYYRTLTQNQTAKIMNISQVQVSRLERKAINKLKEQL